MEGWPRRRRGRGSGAWERRSRGGGRQWSVVTWHRSSPNQEFTVHVACTAKSASGMAGGFIGRQPVTVGGCCTLSNRPDCKRQLSRRHLLADSGIDQVRQ
jgi:hypothetical protein